MAECMGEESESLQESLVTFIWEIERNLGMEVKFPLFLFLSRISQIRSSEGNK